MIPTAHMKIPTYLYHKDKPEGFIFDQANEEEFNRLLSEGWVRTPAELNKQEDDDDQSAQPEQSEQSEERRRGRKPKI